MIWHLIDGVIARVLGFEFSFWVLPITKGDANINMYHNCANMLYAGLFLELKSVFLCTFHNLDCYKGISHPSNIVCIYHTSYFNCSLPLITVTSSAPLKCIIFLRLFWHHCIYEKYIVHCPGNIHQTLKNVVLNM